MTSTSDPKVIALDLETYGACDVDYRGRPLPPQTVFHPHRSLWIDRVPMDQLILTATLTIPTEDPRCQANLIPGTQTDVGAAERSSDTGSPSSTWDIAKIAALHPGETMILRMDIPNHRAILRAWLRHADTILGMNLPFDISYLRAHPEFKFSLDGRHTLIDLAVVNFLHSELRPERSLKTLGPVLGAYVYRESLKDKRFKRPTDKGFLEYAAADTHNTIVAIAKLAARIQQDYKNTHKLSPFSVAHYSSALWTCIRMAEAGIPVDANRLLHIEQDLVIQAKVARRRARRRHNLILEGDGSAKSKTAFINNLITEIDSCTQSSSALPGSLPVSPLGSPSPVPSSSGSASVLNHRLLQLTPAKREVSFGIDNRNLLYGMLPKGHSAGDALIAAKMHTTAQKLASTYSWPLLRHHRRKPNDRKNVLLPSHQPLLQDLEQWKTQPPPLPPAATPSPLLPNTSPSRPSQTTTCTGATTAATTGNTTLSSATTAVSTGTPTAPVASVASMGAAARPKVLIAYPNWMVVPTHPKDGAGDAGGQKQGRVAAKSAAQPQTWPPLIKSAVRSRFPGGTVLAPDLSQIEPRAAALLSGDAGMLQVFREKKVDYHTDTTFRLFGPDIKDKHPSVRHPTKPDIIIRGWKSGDITTDPRQWGKVGGLLLMYRGGWERLQHSVLSDSGVLLPDGLCQQIAGDMPRVRPGLVAWQDRTIALVRKQGYFEVPFVGQSRTFLNTGRERGEEWDENEIVNFPIQCTAGNAMLQIQAALTTRLPRLTDPDPPILMCHNIYDSTWLDCKPGYTDEARELWLWALNYVATEGYWAMLQEYYGNECPLESDVKEL